VNKLFIIFVAIIVLGLGFIFLFNKQGQVTTPVQEKAINEEKKIEDILGKY